jgi:hypothetical protein
VLAVCAASSKGVAQSIIQSAGISFVVGRQQRIKLMCKPSEGGVSHASCFRMFACVSHSLPASLLKNISQKDNSTLIFKRTLSAWVPGKALPQRDRSLEYRLNLKFKRPHVSGEHGCSWHWGFHGPVQQVALKAPDSVVQAARYLRL